MGAVSLCGLPLSLWAASQLHAPVQSVQTQPTPLPVRRMLLEVAGYASFGLGYFVYLTFLSAWMTQQRASAGFIALVWVVLGASLCLSPFVWRPVPARHASGLPLALILTCIAIGSALPVVLPKGPVLLVSAVVFGLAVFMGPGAVTSFARQNLPPPAWGHAMSLFTLLAMCTHPGAAGDRVGSRAPGVASPGTRWRSAATAPAATLGCWGGQWAVGRLQAEAVPVSPGPQPPAQRKAAKPARPRHRGVTHLA